MFKRIILFALTNLMVMVTISIVLNLLGVRHYMTASGIDYQALLIFCLVWGMGGAFISLALSRIMAKWMMGVRVLDPQRAGDLQWLVQTVHQQARQANLPKMPEVGVFESPDVNAFATGPTKARALVAVSSGLIREMSREQVEAVLGHEITHISNGDMVTLTLIQGVVNAFVMFFARVIAYAVSQSVKDDARHMVQFLVTIVLEIGLGLLGVMIVAWFSRQREFRADAGGARLAGREKMKSALQELQRVYGGLKEESKHAAADPIAAFKISGKQGRFLNLFATHPPLSERIARLEMMR